MNLRRGRLFLAVALGSASVASGAVESYTIDPVHSSVTFTIRNFVTKVRGKFGRFSGTIRVDSAHPSQNVTEAVIEVASIDTGNQKRDTHLRSVDFFEVARFPVIKFRSTAWKPTGGSTFEITGDLTIKDVTKQILLQVTVSGAASSNGEDQTSRWDATTTINKKEFNVKDPPLLGAALGDEVAITLHIEATKSLSD